MTNDQNNYARIQMKVLIHDVSRAKGGNETQVESVHSCTLFKNHVKDLLGDVDAVKLRAKPREYIEKVCNKMCDQETIYRAVYRVNSKGYVNIKKIDMHVEQATGDGGAETKDDDS